MYETKISDAKWIFLLLCLNLLCGAAMLVGMLVSLTALAIALTKGLTGTGYLGVLSAGGLLCFVFGGLLLREYKKR